MPVKNFLLFFFSPKLNGQPALKFDKDMDVCHIYCMIPRMFGLDEFPFLVRATPSGRFFSLF
jgi:hypothetical protein